jgi:dihydroflavonol-4-reductase
MSQSRALVTGATGFLGSHIVRELIALGSDVHALARSDASAARLSALGVRPIRGDLADPQALATQIRGAFDVIFHTAADTNTWSRNNALQTRVNVDGTRALLEVAMRTGSGCFVHTSSTSIYGLEDRRLDETSPVCAQDSWINYSRTKALADLSVQEAGRAGLRTVILNPAHIVGPGDTHNWSRLLVMIDRRSLPGVPPGSGDFADVREVARAHVAAWQQASAGERFLLGGTHASFLEFVQIAGRLLNRSVPPRAMPAALVRAMGRLRTAAALFTRREPSLTPEGAALVCHRLEVDSGKAVARLGYRMTPLDSLLADTCAWLREQGLISRR